MTESISETPNKSPAARDQPRIRKDLFSISRPHGANRLRD
jgi:hypothetical protein